MKIKKRYYKKSCRDRFIDEYDVNINFFILNKNQNKIINLK